MNVVFHISINCLYIFNSFGIFGKRIKFNWDRKMASNTIKVIFNKILHVFTIYLFNFTKNIFLFSKYI